MLNELSDVSCRNRKMARLQIFGSAFEQHFSSLFSSFRAKVNAPVDTSDAVEVVFNDNDRIACFYEFADNLVETLDIVHV